MFSVGDSITNDTFKEDFENTASLFISHQTQTNEGKGCYLFIDETGDTFDTATTGETTDCRFSDTLYTILIYAREIKRKWMMSRGDLRMLSRRILR